MFPTRVVPRPVVCSSLALTLLFPAVIKADEPPARRNPITEGFHYKPAPDPDALPAELAPSTSPAGRARKRIQNPTARIPKVAINTNPPAATPEATPTPAPTATPGETFMLPKLTVTGKKEKPPSIPRLHIDAPVKDLPEPEFESPSARLERLVQKHFTASEQKFGGKSLFARAVQKEAAEVAVTDLNRVATILELCAALGLEDEESLKKLQAEFFKAYYERPR